MLSQFSYLPWIAKNAVLRGAYDRTQESSRNTRNNPKSTCPLCRESEGIPLTWGEPNLLYDRMSALVLRGEIACGGDAISCTESGTLLNRECQACHEQWLDVGSQAAESVTTSERTS
jgi:hypothetical protein